MRTWRQLKCILHHGRSQSEPSMQGLTPLPGHSGKGKSMGTVKGIRSLPGPGGGEVGGGFLGQRNYSV